MCTAPWSHPTSGVIKCGQCMECRLAYSREWAIRITHEAAMHDRNCFLTLTYDNDHLPAHGQLVKSDLQKFFKRLRHHFNFKYVACGEYGDRRRRPHFMRLSLVLILLMIVLSTLPVTVVR
ncbi:MAG: replication initiator protein [Microviridae sp.]|nr:MAG: replication initiator protein [Microviridae sp.]